MSTNRRSINQAPGLTAELTRRVGAEAVPHGVRRRASVHTTTQTNDVPAWTSPKSRKRGLPMPVLYILGFIIGAILLWFGSLVLTWVNEINTHWHCGDQCIGTLDANVGHGNGTSHFIAFDSNGNLVIVELASDYSGEHSYVMKAQLSGPHQILLAVQVINGKPDLIVTVDQNQIILYNTGDSFSFTQP